MRQVGRAVERKQASLRWANRLQTIALISGMLLLAAVLARLLLGPLWMPWLVGIVASSLVAGPHLSPAWLMSLSGAMPLRPDQAPGLYALVSELSRRAGLPDLPGLYWIPRRQLNAFAVGTRDDAAIAVTEGLLRALTPRELTGVLAHELAHVRNGDMQVMLLAEFVARLTVGFASLGVFLAVLNLPLVMAGAPTVSWWAILLLVSSPTFSVLLQLAVSRLRERAADLEAADLTGDPRALASALRKIGRLQGSMLESLSFPRRHDFESSWWSTHPATEERIRDLFSLEQKPGERDPFLEEVDLRSLLHALPPRSRRRRYFIL